MKKLNIQKFPREEVWMSQLGCLKSCLDFLQIEVPMPWLYGATGHAFIMHAPKGTCISAPHASTEECIPVLIRLGRNIGYVTEESIGYPNILDSLENREVAWTKTRAAIDQGFPCYGHSFSIEFAFVYGYDDVGYYVNSYDREGDRGPIPWQDVEGYDIYAVKPGKPADDRKTVSEALEFALRYATSPKDWDIAGGLTAYDNWIWSLENGEAQGRGGGMALNAAVWAGCRSFAAPFLEEAKQRIGKHAALFEEAKACYETVARDLGELSKSFPFFVSDDEREGHLQDEARARTGLQSLQKARAAEGKGLKCLAEIVEQLG